MSLALKPDAKKIEEYMQGLATKLRLTGGREHWPNWIYRSDHVENAAAILNTGKLLSRAAAESAGLIVKDAGSPDHIGQLQTKHRRFVRLYFRPRTPTQYSNEGIRPRNKIQYSAHMPVPVYMLFSASLLTLDGIQYSRGRLTPMASTGKTVRFLKSIDFSDVYHDGPVGRRGESGRRSEILNARHSEVIVEDELSLAYLKHIVCRSAPERETLLNLLVPRIREKWIRHIHVDEGGRRLFQKIGTFVQKSVLSSAESRIVFYPNISVDMRGPFDLNIEWESDNGGFFFNRKNFTVGVHPEVYTLGRNLSNYHLRIRLNEDLEFFGKFDKDRASDILF